MKIDFKFDIDETVYYIQPRNSCIGINSKYYEIKEGKIFGFHCIKQYNKILLRVDFKERNGVPIKYVFKNKEEAEKQASKIQGQFYYNGDE